MPDNSPVAARFDHVGPEGKLIFTAGGSTFSVTVDDTLSKAILEARQVIADSQSKPAPAASRVPISQIQSLIRAGANPTKVAEHYDLSETLVRRFSAAVETEKQYAIDQFLNVSAPKDSQAHTLGEIIESSLATLGTGMEGGSWRATRRGLEPWRISARFVTPSGTINAEWSWDMHDNSVSCMNDSARGLLDLYPPRNEQGEPIAPPNDAHPTPYPASAKSTARGRREDIPGRSIQSARIERAVSSWALSDPGTSRDDTTSGNASAKRDSEPIDGTPRQVEETLRVRPPQQTRTDHTSRRASSLDPVAVVAEAASPSPSSASTSRGSLADNLANVADLDDERPAHPHALSPERSTTMPDSGSHDAGSGSNNQSVSKPQSVTNPDAATPAPQSKGTRKHSGRSAVPSWDEILFGD